MHLPFEIVRDHLSRKWPVRSFPEEGQYPDIFEPFLFSSEMPLHRSSTVIANTADLPCEPFLEDLGCLICCGGLPPAGYLRSELSMIIIDSPVDMVEVLNCLQLCFYHYSVWLGQLRRLGQRNASLQDILNTGSLMFDNRLEVTDAGHTFVAAAQEGHTRDRASRPAGFHYSTIDPERFMEYKTRYKALRESRKAFLWYEEFPEEGIVPFPTLCMNLLDGDLFIGAVTVQPTVRGFLPGDHRLLELLAPFIRNAMLNPPENDHTDKIMLLRDILLGILMGHEPDHKLLSHLSGMTRFSLDSDIRCIAVMLPDGKNQNEFGQYLKKHVLSLYPDSIIFVFNKYLVVFARSYQTESDSLHIESLAALLSGVNSQAGISDPFSDLTMVRYYYQEAVFASKTAGHGIGSLPIAFFSDCLERFIYEHCHGELPPELLFPKGLRRLIEHDESSQISYIDTLKVFLDNDRNTAKSAKALFISRNAMLSRLEKIDPLLGMNLDDPDARFRLDLCLRLKAFSEL